MVPCVDGLIIILFLLAVRQSLEPVEELEEIIKHHQS